MDFFDDDPDTYFQNLIRQQRVDDEVKNFVVEKPLRPNDDNSLFFKMIEREDAIQSVKDTKSIINRKPKKPTIMVDADLELEFDDLFDGFLATNEKEKFITEHSELIQMLDVDDQSELISLFVQHI